MSNSQDADENTQRLSLSPSPSRESSSSNIDDDLDLSSPNSSFGRNDAKDSGSLIETQASNEKSSEDNSEEKSSDGREKHSEHDTSPDEKSGKSNQPSASSSSSPDEMPGSSSTASTSATSGPSTSTPTGSHTDKKRRSTDSDDELKQAIKRFKKQDEERMKMQVLVSNFTEEQLNRYEMYRRATFPRAAIKRLMQNIIGTSVSQNVVIAMSGISKVFVGEVLETALDVSERWGDSGPLQPKHLREAVRILNSKGMMPTTKSKKSLF